MHWNFDILQQVIFSIINPTMLQISPTFRLSILIQFPTPGTVFMSTGLTAFAPPYCPFAEYFSGDEMAQGMKIAKYYLHADRFLGFLEATVLLQSLPSCPGYCFAPDSCIFELFGFRALPNWDSTAVGELVDKMSRFRLSCLDFDCDCLVWNRFCRVRLLS